MIAVLKTSVRECELHEMIGCTICSGKDRATRNNRELAPRERSDKIIAALKRCGGGAHIRALRVITGLREDQIRSAAHYLDVSYGAVTTVNGNWIEIVNLADYRAGRRKRHPHYPS